MSIVTSEITEDRAQADGRRSIAELHGDDTGGQHRRSYIAPADFDNARALNASATRLDAQLVEQETARQAEAVRVSALGKLRTWIDDTANVGTRLGLTAEEEAALKDSRF